MNADASQTGEGRLAHDRYFSVLCIFRHLFLFSRREREGLGNNRHRDKSYKASRFVFLLVRAVPRGMQSGAEATKLGGDTTPLFNHERTRLDRAYRTHRFKNSTATLDPEHGTHAPADPTNLRAQESVRANVYYFSRSHGARSRQPLIF